jgi:hypothetical protein
VTLRPWLDALALTQLVEAPLYVWLLRGAAARARGLGGGAGWLAALGASAWTHPVVWFVFPPCVFGVWQQWLGAASDDPKGYIWMLTLAEAFAVAGEAAYWRALTRLAGGAIPWREALRWSLLANGASVLVGVVTRWVWGWP